MFWLIILVFIASIGISFAIAPKPPSNNAKPAGIGDLNAPTAEVGRAIPVLFGTRDMKAPNIVWYGNLVTQAITQGGQTTGYRYYLGMHLVICHGPIDYVSGITVGEKLAWTGMGTGGGIIIDNEFLFGGQDAGSEGGVKGAVGILMGYPEQPPDTYLVSQLGPTVPGYRGVVSLVAIECYLGTNPYIKPWAIRGTRIHVRQNGVAQWYDEKAEIISVSTSDLGPAHVIRECLTDFTWGMGYQDADINATFFEAAADTLFAEGFGFSLLWDTDAKLEDFINNVIQHIDAALYVSRKTGQFVLKLIRNDYNVDDLLSFDESNISKVANPSKPAFGELINGVTVQFWNAANGTDDSVTVSDPAMVQMQGNQIATTVQYPGFSNLNNASRAAQRDLKALSTSFLACTIYTNRDAKDLNIGDVFKFSWKRWGIVNMVMRITGIAFGDGKTNVIRITCTEDVYSTPQTPVVSTTGTAWVDPAQPPDAISDFVDVYSNNYYELVQRFGRSSVDTVLAARPDATWMIAAAGRPANALTAEVWVSKNSLGYLDKTPLQFCPSARMAFGFSAVETSIHLTEAGNLDKIRIGSYATVSGTGEIIRIDAVDVANSIITVGRGCIDTSPHQISGEDATQLIMFMDDLHGLDPTEYKVGDELDIKIVTASGVAVQNFAEAYHTGLEPEQRAILPYVAGNLRVNGVLYPDWLANPPITGDKLHVTWSHRDRTQELDQIYDCTYGNIGPETGVSYELECSLAPDDESDVINHTETGLVGTTFNWMPGKNGIAEFTLTAIRDGLRSWDTAFCSLRYVVVEDIDPGSNRLTETGDQRVTETDDHRITE